MCLLFRYRNWCATKCCYTQSVWEYIWNNNRCPEANIPFILKIQHICNFVSQENVFECWIFHETHTRTTNLRLSFLSFFLLFLSLSLFFFSSLFVCSLFTLISIYVLLIYILAIFLYFGVSFYFHHSLIEHHLFVTFRILANISLVCMLWPFQKSFAHISSKFSRMHNKINNPTKKCSFFNCFDRVKNKKYRLSGYVRYYDSIVVIVSFCCCSVWM